MYNSLAQNLETLRFGKFDDQKLTNVIRFEKCTLFILIHFSTLKIHTLCSGQTGMMLAVNVVLLFFYHSSKFQMFIYVFPVAFYELLNVQNLSNGITNSCRKKF